MYHTLQLMDKDKDSKSSMAHEAARCTAEFFKIERAGQQEAQKQAKAEGHKLTQGATVRWNSSYYLVKHLLEQWWPVTATISDPEITQKGKHYLGLKSDQWKLLERPKQVLEPFEQATVFLSSEAYATVSALPPLVKVLQMFSQKTSFGSASVNSFLAAAAQEIALQRECETTFRDQSKNVCLKAVAFHPRFHKHKFLYSLYNKLHNEIKMWFHLD